MLDVTGILCFAFIRVCRAHLSDIKSRYKEKEWLGILCSFAEKEFRNAVGEILLPGINDIDKEIEANNPGDDNGPSSKELYSLVCEMKEQLKPADYLFFKAIVTEKEEDTIFLFQQAQMISPENLRFQIMTSFITNEDDEPVDMCLQLESLVRLTDKQDVKDYSYLLNLVREMSKNPGKISPMKFVSFINRVPLPYMALYSLLFELGEKIEFSDKEQLEPSALKKILQHLDLPRQERNWIYQFLQAKVCFAENNYDNALSWYSGINTERNDVGFYQTLEILYKQAVSYRETGKEGKAILQLREIVFSGLYDDSYSDYYFHSLVDLAGYYVRIGENREADNVLSKLKAEMLSYVEEMIGEDYLVLMADKSMLEYDVENALKYYKKAFGMTGNKEIEKKIKMLEGGEKA